MVIMILNLRICFVLRISNLLLSLLYALRVFFTTHDGIRTEKKGENELAL